MASFPGVRQKTTTTISSGHQYIPEKVVFSVFTAEEMRKLSAVKIITPLTLNPLGHPVPGGLYDPAMGPLTDRSDPCKTCLKNIYGCPGHLGHIDLPVPVTNPLFHKPISVFMKMACLNCYRLQLPPLMKWQIIAQLQLVEAGFITEALEIETSTSDGTDISNVHPDIQEAMAKEKMCDYIKKVFETMAPASSDSSSKAAESVRNVIFNNLVREEANKAVCTYCKGSITKLTLFKGRLTQTVRVNVAPKHQQGDDTLANVSLNSSFKSSKYSASHRTQVLTLNPKEIKNHLQKLWVNEKEFLCEVMPILKNRTIEFPTDVFFLDVIPVPPPNVRPANMVRGQLCEHPQTTLYRKVTSDSLVVWNVIQMMHEGTADSLTADGKMLVQGVQGSTPVEKLHFAWEALQASADRLLDAGNTLIGSRMQGLKQVLEKKEGIIRMHMMGKRVNYAARSVITPDPNLNVDEIGFPEAFALKLTYPVPVTPWNVKELRKMVQNGPMIHPGAVMVEDENGFINRLNEDDPLQREAIAKRLLTPGDQAKSVSRGMKKVYRHLVNGDILLLNRQPTLHRPSIMAHKARILKGEKTLRMHYSNCKSYNADFDGDEMNAHFPQSEVARSEAYNLVSVCHQYLVPKDGTPLGGLIQDHMVSGVRLSIRGKFFTKEDYMQLVYQSISDLAEDIKLLPPAVLKPLPLWSGKQVISTVLINTIPRGKHLINLTATAKIRGNAWEKQKPRSWRAGGTPFKDSSTMSEAEVIIRQGELLCGVLDKTHYGATPYGLVHCMYELYGGVCSSRLLSSFAKLFMAFLQLMEGFTLGVEDILVVENADKRRLEIIQASRKIGDAAAAAALHLPPETPPDILTQKMEESYNNPKINFRGEIDRQYKVALNSFTDDINKTCLPAGLLQQFPDNNLQLMVQSGAKGSTVNTMQISCLLGQIELEGKRPPLMVSGRSLPSFAPYDRQPRAGGFIDGRFMTGIQPQEFFFHCMAGREGLIDTAVKTSRSGYLQRCLVKNLEGLSIHYDMTVRDSDGSVVQFAYGEDGMDISKVQFLNPEHMPFLEENQQAISDRKFLTALKNEDGKAVAKHKKAVKKWRKTIGTDKVRKSTFLNFSVAMQKCFKSQKLTKGTGRRKGTQELVELFRETSRDDPEMKKLLVDKYSPDPVAAVYPACAHFGVLTERLESIVDDYVTKKKKLGGFDENEFRDMLYLKSVLSLAPAGDPVGLLAAQSVGEPSTQMTLNTFHFAGRGEMNVTLGIPRLKEILMTASKNISTPSMEIPFRKDVPKIIKKAESLKVKLTRITIADVLEFVEVTESLVLVPHRVHQYVMKMQFLPFDCYKKEYCVTPKIILKHVEHKFLDALQVNIRKLAKSSGQTISIENEVKKSMNETTEISKDVEGEVDDLRTVARKTGTGEGHESSDEDSEGDDEDATAAMRRIKHHDMANYSDESDGEGSDSTGEEKDEHNAVKEDEEEEERQQGNAEMRQSYVVHRHQFVEEYTYDLKNEEWCIVKLCIPIKLRKINLSTLIQEAAHRSVVWQVPGLKRAFLLNNPCNGLTLKTDGLNIIEMFKYNNLLDLNKLYSNDIHAIAVNYGIEAAGRVIVKEIQDVFKVYGITVDPRHLMLISDFMTYSGSFLPMSRTGMESNPSAFQKMSFEASVISLKKAIWLGKTDPLDSPSSRICVGKPCKSGTGAFQLRHKLPVK